MGLLKREKAGLSITREAALGARPRQAPFEKREEKEGKLYITVQLRRPAWQRLLGADKFCDRTFGLDGYGQFVYQACDGKTTVKRIIRDFAAGNKVSVPEAELAVTKFVSTLLTRGLIYLEVER